MSTVDNSDKLIRQQLISEALLSKAQASEFTNPTIEEVAKFILKTFGQIYAKEVLEKLKCGDLKNKITSFQLIVDGIHTRLKTNKFGIFVQKQVDSTPLLAGTNVNEIGDENFRWTLFLPWPVQQLRAISNIYNQWKREFIDDLISTVEKEEADADAKLLKAIEARSVEPSDIHLLEKYLCKPIVLFKESDSKSFAEMSLYSLIQCWSIHAEKHFEEDFLAKFKLLSLVKKDPLTTLIYKMHSGDNVNTQKKHFKPMKSAPITISAASAPSKTAHSIVPSNITFAEFRISYLIQRIGEKLNVDFFDGTQFSSRFFKCMQDTLAKSVAAMRDAVFFAGSPDFPKNSEIESFLNACAKFIEFRKKANSKVNINFILEWICFAEMDERNFSTSKLEKFDGQEEFLRKVISDIQISPQKQFHILLCILNLNSFLEFANLIREIKPLANPLFLLEFFKKGINLANYADLSSGCKLVDKTFQSYFEIVHAKHLFWIDICLFINSSGIQKLIDFVNDFSEIIPSQTPAYAVKTADGKGKLETGNELANCFQAYLSNVVQILFQFLKELIPLKINFSKMDKYNLVLRIANLKSPILLNTNEQNELNKGLRKLCELVPFTIQQIGDLYVLYLSKPKHYSNLHYENIFQIVTFLNHPLLAEDIHYLLTRCPRPESMEEWIKEYCTYRQTLLADIRKRKASYITDYHCLETLQKLQNNSKTIPFLERNETENLVLLQINTTVKIAHMMTSSIIPRDHKPITDCFSQKFFHIGEIGNESLILLSNDYQIGKAVHRKWHIPKSPKDSPSLEISLINMSTYDVCMMRESFPMAWEEFSKDRDCGLMHTLALQPEQEHNLKDCATFVKNFKKFYEIGMLSLSLSESDLKGRDELLQLTGLKAQVKKLIPDNTHATSIAEIEKMLKEGKDAEKSFSTPKPFTCMIKVINVKKRITLKEITFKTENNAHTVRYAPETQEKPFFSKLLLWQLLSVLS